MKYEVLKLELIDGTVKSTPVSATGHIHFDVAIGLLRVNDWLLSMTIKIGSEWFEVRKTR